MSDQQMPRKAASGAAPEVSVVMPCLNEAETLATCIEKAQRCLRELGISGELVVADNGSTDGSIEIASRLGARVVGVPEKGYGSALMGGILAARGTYVIMGDADDSYDFAHLGPFVDSLRRGNELVMGNRFRGGIRKHAMPPLHRYLGNPVLSAVGRLFFRSPCGDFHCGLRGFQRAAILRLDLRTTGMEFASEMVVKATLHGLRITEVPTVLSPAGRSRPPHLRSFRDGWRHLRFLLLYSPRWLFLYPGLLLALAGASAGVWLMTGPKAIGGVRFDVHTLVYAAMAVVLGFQSIVFAVFAKVFAIIEGLLPPDPKLDRWFRVVTLEVGLALAAMLFAAGLAGTVWAVTDWARQSFGALDPTRTLRVVIPSTTLMVLGFQAGLSSFLLSLLGMKRR